MMEPPRDQFANRGPATAITPPDIMPEPFLPLVTGPAADYSSCL